MSVQDVLKSEISQAVANTANLTAIYMSDPVEAQAVQANLGDLSLTLQAAVDAWFAGKIAADRTIGADQMVSGVQG